MRLFVLDEPVWGQGQSWRQNVPDIGQGQGQVTGISFITQSLVWVIETNDSLVMRSTRWFIIYDSYSMSHMRWRHFFGCTQVQIEDGYLGFIAKYSFTNWLWKGLTYRKIKILLDVVIADICKKVIRRYSISNKVFVRTYKVNKRIDTR